MARQRELAALAERLAARNPVALVGEAGIGKTTLLRAAAAAAGKPVYEGGGLASLSWRSYFSLTRAAGAEPPQGDQAFVADWLVRRVRDGVLLLDDLHWADSETLNLLPNLVGRTPLLAAVRQGDPGAGSAIAQCVAAGIETLDVSALEQADAAALARLRRPELSERAVEQIVVRASGNPLLVEELAAGETGRRFLRLGLNARLLRCSDEAQRAMALLGLLGRPADAALIERGVEELRTAGLLAPGVLVEPRHSLLGEVAVGMLRVEQRRRLHAWLARNATDSAEAARHHHAAGEHDQAYEKAMAAVDDAVRPGDRARLLGLAALTGTPRVTDELRLEAAAALIEAGEHEVAAEVLDKVEGNEPLVRAEVHLLRARRLSGTPFEDAFERELRAGLALAEGTNSRVEVLLCSELVERPLRSWDGPVAVERAELAWSLAKRLGVGRARARFQLGQARFASEDLRACLHDLRAAARFARREDEPRIELRARGTLGAAYQELERPHRAFAITRAARERAHRLHLRSTEYLLRQGEVVYACSANGPSTRLVDDFHEALEEPTPSVMREQCVAELALLLGDIGRDEEARNTLGDAARPRAGHVAFIYEIVAAELDWLAGRLEAAASRRPPAGAPGWAVESLDIVRAFALVELRSAPEAFPAPPENASLERSSAALEGLRALADPERAPEAERLLLSAAPPVGGPKMRERLRLVWNAAEAARRAGEEERARHQLLHLESECSVRGLAPLLGRVRRSLRLLGHSAPSAAADRSRVLTLREREVMSLVALGLSSPAIAARLSISATTVDTHVRAARAKLGARTRAEAAARAEALLDATAHRL